jgi:hypothetical protein
MKPIIQQLQIDAANDNTSVSQLLRKAKIAATKLELKDFLTWINKELNGYDPGDELPEYREIPADLRAFNPFRGWQPVRFEDVETQNIVSKRGVSQPISELEKLNEDSNGDLRIPLNPEAYNNISKAVNFDGEIVHFVANNSIDGIIGAVKNRILDIALELESNGITGDSVSFTAEEKDKANNSHIHIGSIGNFSGAIGPVSENSTVKSNQTNYCSNDILEFIEVVKSQKDRIGLSQTDSKKLTINISELETASKSSAPNQEVISSRLFSIKNVLEQASGNIVAQMLLAGLARLTGV